MLKAGSIGQLTICMENMLIDIGGDIHLQHLRLDLASTTEESLVFYDALDSSQILEPSAQWNSTPLSRMASDLGLDLEEDETQKHDLLESLLGTFLCKFNFTIEHIDIFIHGPQDYQKLRIAIPKLEIYQPKGLPQISVDLSKGLECYLINGKEETLLVKIHSDVALLLNGDSGQNMVEARIKDPIVAISPRTIVLLKEFKRIYRMNKNPGLASKDPLLIPVEIVLKDVILDICDDDHEARLEVSKLTCSYDAKWDLSIDNGILRDDKGDKLLAFDQIKGDLTTTKINLFELYQISPSTGNLLKKCLDSAFKSSSGGSNVFANIPSLKILAFNFKVENYLFLEHHRATLNVGGLEICLDRKQSSLHMSTLFLQIDEIHKFNLSRLSIYRSERDPMARVFESPFSQYRQIIEGIEFVSTLTNPEEYFLLRSRMIEGCEQHWHMSADQLKICLDSLKVTDMLGSWENKDFDPEAGMSSSQKLCVTLSINKIDFRDSFTKLEINVLSIEGLLNKEAGRWAGDVRLVPETVLVGRKLVPLFSNALTTSLDPHYKSFVVSFQIEAAMVTISTILSGGIISIPIFDSVLEDLRRSIDGLLGRHPSESKLATGRTIKLFCQLSLCSIRPILPGSYQKRMAPHVLYTGNIRTVFESNEPLICFLQDGEVFMAPSSKLVRPVTGLFDEGHNYWEEQNYEAVVKVDFLALRARVGEGRLMVELEDNMASIDLHGDSLGTITRLFKNYQQLFRDDSLSRAKKNEEEQRTVPKSEEELTSMLEMMSTSINEMEKMESSFFDEPSMETIDLSPVDPIDFEGDFYGIVDGENEYGFAELNNLIELELPDANKKEEKLTHILEDHGGEEDLLEIEENFFVDKINEVKSRFPFSEEDQVLMRLTLKKFSLKVRLISGRHWNPNRPNHILAQTASIASSSPTKASSHSRSFAGGRNRSISGLSSSASSKWSHPSGISLSRPRASPDAVELICSGIDAELDWTDPFPEDLNAPKSLMTGARLTIDTLEIVDQVKSSKWQTFMKRQGMEKESQQSPALRGEINTFYIPREDETHTLLPEDQLESHVRVALEPLRFHIDQDTLIFILSFFESSKRERNGVDEDRNVEEEISPLFLQKFSLAPLSLRIDYKPKKINIRKAFGGHYVEMINFFPLEDADINLPGITLTGLNGLGELFQGLLRSWLPHVRNTQLPQVAKGITPVRTVMNVGDGLTDLILLPLDHYKRDGKIVRGLRKGTKSFLYSTALEGARIGKKLAKGAKMVLRQADDIFHLENHAEEEDHLEPPMDALDGLANAYGIMEGSVKGIGKTIVAIPLEIWQSQGPGKAAKAVLRAMPVVILKSLHGASDAICQTMMGVEGSLDPGKADDLRQKYKKPMDPLIEEDDVDTLSPRSGPML